MEKLEFEIDEDAPLSVALSFHRKKKKSKSEFKHEKLYNTENAQEEEEVGSGINVSVFDYSIQNHLEALRAMFSLCGDHHPHHFDFSQPQSQRLSSSITFLKEWRGFHYKPKTIRFASQNVSSNRKDVIGEISLPQFSAASVPKDIHDKETTSSQTSEDFVIYAGGSVWALDWCPRANQQSGSGLKMEFVAVAAHPPGSSYHKIGSALTGRGAIQIWCMLDVIEEIDSSQVQIKPKHCYRKRQADNIHSAAAKRPRGRPRKDRTTDTLDNIKSGSQVMEITAKDTHEGVTPTKSENVPAHAQRREKFLSIKGQTDSPKSSAATKLRERPRRNARIEAPEDVNRGISSIEPLAIEYTHNSTPLDDVPLPRTKHVSKKGQTDSPNSSAATQPKERPRRNARIEALDDVIRGSSSIEPLAIECTHNSTPLNDVPLPRMMLCLAHNGKVVWDLKWQPSNSHDKHRLGYLAVVLGSGVIEVWEVPFPYTVEAIYSSSPQLECTDPRFIKLEPVFRCSKLNCGDKQSIPLTVEWSTSSPHDTIVAGCHDGVVALWKFSVAVPCKETKPLLRFNADTVPIRTIAWAPAESNGEGSNVIVTGGNKGLKFWDLRDPFHALWDFNSVHMNILSLDWLPDPRCVVISIDDGTLRVLSLMKAAHDSAVTGKPFTGTPQQGFSSYFCSSFAIWDVHVSRKTGMVAYCGVDGNALRFQLTTRAVERDPLRGRAPHFLCGSLTGDQSELTVVTPQNDIPFPMKTSLHEWGDAPRTKRGFLSLSNQKKREEMEKNKLSDEPQLALCYGNDPGGESDTDPSTPQKTKQAHKSTINKTSKANERTLICVNENPDSSQNVMDQENVVDEIDHFPPKSIAIHRIRWNMNKGSERWLCYGGASGIIRFQKVDISIV